MSAFSGSFATVSFAEVLRMLVNTKQTGYLEIRHGNQPGFLAIENGVLIYAQTGRYTALQALFQFIVWREADFDFQEARMESDLPRELSVYDPQVLVAGVVAKVDELASLQQAIPSIDSVLYYVGGEALDTVEATPSDLGLLILADGNRSVREIAEAVKLNPLEVMRRLARFRLAGVLELVAQHNSLSNSEMAATSHF